MPQFQRVQFLNRFRLVGGCALLMALIIFLFSFQNCSDVHLKRPVEQAIIQSSKDELCVAPPEGTPRYSKVIFVVDKSGSNQNTDPTNIRRADNIQAFVNSKRGDPFYKWSYIVFGLSSSDAQAYINKDNNVKAPVFGTPADMDTAIARHRATRDNGCTPYLAGLDLAQTAIKDDIEAFPDEDSVYNIFFISDGFPTDSGATRGGCGGARPVRASPEDPYIKKVVDLVALLPDRIFVNTAYYTPAASEAARSPDQRAAAEGLAYMATAGKGLFTDFLNNDKISFNEVKTGTRPERWMIKRMMTYNLNSAFCSDATIDADSDADGICDKDEQLYNNVFAAKLPPGLKFDPQNRNSIDNTYSDAFSFNIISSNNTIEPCTLPNDDKDMDMLNQCEERMLSDSQANGPTPQWTDQLKTLYGGAASPKNPDSDGDGFMDSLEFFVFGVNSAPVNYLNLQDRYSGGITGETILAEHRHPRDPTRFDSDNYDANLIHTGINSDGQNCYRFNQTQLALYPTQPVTPPQVSGYEYLAHETDENIVLVYYIVVRERDPNGKGVMLYSFQRFRWQDASFNAGISLSKGFEQYTVPKQ